MHQKLNERVVDLNPQETAEWVESLDQVIDQAGPDRATFLLDHLNERARANGAEVPVQFNTPYINTIRPEEEVAYPGDRAMERRIKSLIRWNAMAMVVRQNKYDAGIGGHISTYASLATLLGSGLQPFLPRQLRRSARRPDLLPGPRLSGCLRPRLPGRPPHRRAPEEFPPRTARDPRPFLLPAPVADARFLELPHRLHGPRADQRHLPGALHALPGKSRHHPGNPAPHLGLPRRRRNGRARIHGLHHSGLARKAGQPHLRHQLQSAAPRRSGARQRQGHPGTRSRLPRRRLERHQSDLGRRLGSAAGARHHRSAAKTHGRSGGWRVPDLRHQGRRLHPPAFLRQVPRTARTRIPPERRGSLQAAPRRPRSQEGLQRLPAGARYQGQAYPDSGPHRQGLRPRRSRRRPQHFPPAEETQRSGDRALPLALRNSDSRRSGAQRFLLPAAFGQPGDELPARTAAPAGRLHAQPQRIGQQRRRASPGVPEGVAGRLGRPRSLQHHGHGARAHHAVEASRTRQARGAHHSR